jgi:hypothetical protein
MPDVPAVSSRSGARAAWTDHLPLVQHRPGGVLTPQRPPSRWQRLVAAAVDLPLIGRHEAVRSAAILVRGFDRGVEAAAEHGFQTLAQELSQSYGGYFCSAALPPRTPGAHLTIAMQDNARELARSRFEHHRTRFRRDIDHLVAVKKQGEHLLKTGCEAAKLPLQRLSASQRATLLQASVALAGLVVDESLRGASTPEEFGRLSVYHLFGAACRQVCERGAALLAAGVTPDQTVSALLQATRGAETLAHARWKLASTVPAESPDEAGAGKAATT